MSTQKQQIDQDIFTVAGLFTFEECLQLIERAEAIGFQAASVKTSGGQKMMTQVRNNDRVTLEDDQLAAEMWRRIETFLPILDGCQPCSVDSLIRFYRYLPGQQFKRHKDGYVTNSLGQISKLSYLIYLNDDCEGGHTTFHDYREVDGERQAIEHAVTPTVGTALLFRHAIWHEGTPVTAGRKYVLRSDVFYEKSLL